jgi:hypothetical protein
MRQPLSLFCLFRAGNRYTVVAEGMIGKQKGTPVSRPPAFVY